MGWIVQWQVAVALNAIVEEVEQVEAEANQKKTYLAKKGVPATRKRHFVDIILKQ